MRRVREAMIVAGGAGTRLRPLTLTTPKPLLPFCDAPFLLGVIDRLAEVGISRVLLVVGRDTQPFGRLTEPAAARGVSLETVAESEPLDTAGGVLSALDRVSGPFLVLNGDILTNVDLRRAIDRHHASGAGATIVLTRVEDTSSFGVCVLDGTRIVGFVEKPAPGSLPGQDTVNAGTYVLEPEVLQRFTPGPLSFERQVFPTLLEASVHVEGFVGGGVWADLGTPERYLGGHRLALDGVLDWPALRRLGGEPGGVRVGSRVRWHPSGSVQPPSLLGDGTRVDQGARVGPYTVLGAGAHVGPDSWVRDSVLGRDTRVGAGTRLRQVVTGSGVVIGDGVRAEDGAVIGDDTQVPDGAVLPPGLRMTAAP